MNDDGALRSETMFPLAWRVARAYRNERLEKPRSWLLATKLVGDVRALVRALETYLGRQEALVDLSDWVLDELPQREAHFIDSDTDSEWAFFLLQLAEMAAGGTPARYEIGPNVYGRRESLLAVLADFEARSDRIERDFGLTGRGPATIRQLREALESAVATYEARGREATVAADLDPQKTSGFVDAFVRYWQAGFPRQLLTEVGSVRVVDRRWPRRRFRIATLVPKDLLIADNGYVEDTEFLGRNLANAMTHAEARAIAVAVRDVRPTGSGSTFAVRFSRVFKAMAKRGCPATHILIPYRHEIEYALVGLGFTYGESPTGRRGLHRDSVWAIGWPEADEDSVLLLDLPGAVSVEQYASAGGQPLSVQVERIDKERALQLAEPGQVTFDVAPEDPIEYLQTRARIEIEAAWNLTVRRRHIRRVSFLGNATNSPDADPT
jgi:hypothetical protein